ncbi:MAG TPA: hypothetical protein VGK88_05730 [bacterium]|jgi:hypothetical protein
MRYLATVLLATATTVALAGPSPAIPEPIVLPRPPFAYSYNGANGPVPTARLVKIAEKPNRITDVDRWFQTNNIQWPALDADRLSSGDRGRLPPAVPLKFAGQRLIRAVISPPLVVAIYGEDFAGGRYVVGYDPARQTFTFAFDFKNYIVPPAFAPADRDYVDESVQWVQFAGGVLYVSNFHRTYARSSKGLNGYITAIDLTKGTISWRSRPLVINANNFVVAGEVVIAGYGFTAEPDFLYLLNRANGTVIQTVPLRSGPEYLALRKDTLFVRTYNTDAVFRLAR